jgi:hypothetical protein
VKRTEMSLSDMWAADPPEVAGSEPLADFLDEVSAPNPSIA